MTNTQQEEHFRAWLSAHKGIVFKVVHAYANGTEDADDLFQEITFQLWKSIPSYQAKSSVPTWIYKVALYAALAWRRKEKKHHHNHVPAIEIREPSNLEDGATPERRELVEKLYTEIRKLRPENTALALLYLDGQSYRTMAETMGISESNVGVRLNRIKKRLTEGMGACDEIG